MEGHLVLRGWAERTPQSFCAFVPVRWTRPDWVIEPQASQHPCRPLLHQAPAQTWLISSHLTPGLCPIHLHFHPAICFLNKTLQCRMLTHSAPKGPRSPWCSTSRPKLNYLLFAKLHVMRLLLSLEISIMSHGISSERVCQWSVCARIWWILWLVTWIGWSCSDSVKGTGPFVWMSIMQIRHWWQHRKRTVWEWVANLSNL